MFATPYSSLSDLNGMKFTTMDQDNDEGSGGNCATHHGGWWYNNCGVSKLNGQNFDDGKADSSWSGILWYSNDWSTDSKRSLKTTTMAIRPNNGNQHILLMIFLGNSYV